MSYILHATFIAPESRTSAVLTFSLSSTYALGTAVPSVSSFLGTIGGNRSSAFYDKRSATTIWRLIDVFMGTRLIVHFLWFLPDVPAPPDTALVCWTSLPNETWWSSNLGNILGFFTHFAEATVPTVQSWPAYLSRTYILLLKGKGLALEFGISLSQSVGAIQSPTEGPHFQQRTSPLRSSHPNLLQTDERNIWGCKSRRETCKS